MRNWGFYLAVVAAAQRDPKGEEKDLPAGKSFMALLNRAYVSTCTRFAADVSRICSAKAVNVSGICSTGLTSVQFAQPL